MAQTQVSLSIKYSVPRMPQQRKAGGCQLLLKKWAVENNITQIVLYSADLPMEF